MAETLSGAEGAPISREARLWLSTEAFLRTFPAQVEDATYRAAILHWFDPDVLRAVSAGRPSTLRPDPEPDAQVDAQPTDIAEIYRELQSFPFVEDYAERGHNLHSLTRKTILRHLWDQDRTFYREVSQLAADYFSRGLGTDEGAEFVDMVEHAYHLLVADEDEGMAVANTLISLVGDYGQFEFSHALVEAVQEHVDAGRVSDELRWQLTLWRARDANAARRHEDAIRLAAQIDTVDWPPAPTRLKGELARFAADSLTALSRFDEAYDWLQRARRYEQPGTSDATLNSAGLGTLFYSWNRFTEAELAFLDALDSHVTSRLLPLIPLEINIEDGTDDGPTTLWMIADSDQEGAVKPPGVQAHHPPAWITDEDGTYYVAVRDPERPDAADLPALWPVDVDSFLGWLWESVALVYEANDDYRRADAAARLAGSIAIDVEDADTASHAAQLLYRVGGRLGDVKLARAVIKDQERLLASAEARGDLKARASALFNLASAYGDALNFRAARDRFDQALALARQMGDPLAQADALDGLAGLDWTQGRHADAALRLESALDLLAQAGALGRQADLLSRLAAFSLARFRPDEAKDWYQQALQRYREIQLPSGEFNALRGLGQVAENRLRYDDAQEHYQAAVDLARRLDSASLQADGLALLGSLQSLRNDHAAARATFQTALELAGRVGDRAKEAELLLGLAGVELGERKPEVAEETYRRARKIFAELKRPDSELAAMFGILAAQTDREHYRRAVRTADALVALADRIGDLSQRAHARRDAGLAYSDAGLHGRAAELMTEAIELDPDDVELVGSLSWVLVAAGEYAQALDVSERALAADSTLAWVICNRALALLGLGRPAEALAAYREAIAVRPEGQQFRNDIRVLARFLRENSASPEGEEALRLLEEEQARAVQAAPSRSPGPGAVADPGP